MKILFTDLDGTLLNNQSKISEGSYKYLKNFVENGNVLVLASGRPYESIMQVAKEAGIDFNNMYLSASNGALIYNCDDKKAVFEERVSMDNVQKIWELAKDYKIHIQTYTDNAIISSGDDKEIEFYRRRIHLPFYSTDNPMKYLKDAPYKLLAISLDDREFLEAFGEKVKNTIPGVNCVLSNSKYLEIFSSDAGKGQSLIWLCNHLGIDIKDSIAAGDSFNDISMIEAAGTGIAMKNSEPELFEKCNRITKYSNDEDGLIKDMMEFV